jgi:hypothetical protein
VNRRTTVALLLCVALGGCGGNATPEPQTAPSTAPAQDTSVKFVACLRENGISIADPAPDGSITLPKNVDSTKMTNAMQACQQYNPIMQRNVKNPAYHDWQVKLAECLRAEGLDTPDPPLGQPLQVKPHGKPRSEVEKLYETCHSKVGTPPGGGG